MKLGIGFLLCFSVGLPVIADQNPNTRDDVFQSPEKTVNAIVKEFYLVLGSFNKRRDAEQHRHELLLEIATPLKIQMAITSRGTYYRVVFGPLSYSDKTLQQEFVALGYKDAWWITRSEPQMPVLQAVSRGDASLGTVTRRKRGPAPKLVEINIPVKPPTEIYSSRN